MNATGNINPIGNKNLSHFNNASSGALKIHKENVHMNVSSNSHKFKDGKVNSSKVPFSNSFNLTKFQGMKSNLHNQTKGNFSHVELNKNLKNNQSTSLHKDFIDKFLNNKITNYYKYLHKKYSNTTYYGAIKLIANSYFKQFKAELNKIEYNVSNDIKDMETNLVHLYYETTSTTESVDSLIIHYIENKTNDLETYVKKCLHMKTDVMTNLSSNHARKQNIINNKTLALNKHQTMNQTNKLSIAIQSLINAPVFFTANTSDIKHQVSMAKQNQKFSQIQSIRNHMNIIHGSQKSQNNNNPQNMMGIVTKLPLAIKKEHSKT